MVVALMLALAPTLTDAQTSTASQASRGTVSPSFASLAGQLTVDQKVIVIDRAGVETRGRVDAITLTSLRVIVNGKKRDFTDTEVRAIVVEKRATRRGALIGLAVGAGAGIALGHGYASGGGRVILSGLMGGIGAGIGAAVGAAFVHRESLYDDRLSQTPAAVARPAALAPQSTGASLARPRPDYKWAASAVMGTTSSGPSRDFERAMREAQFDESRGACFLGGLCLPGSEHPTSGSGFGYIGFPWDLSVQRRFSSWWGLGLSAGHAPIGEAHGQKRDTLDYLTVSYRVTTVAPLFVVGPAQGFRAAAGPAFFSSSFRAEESGMRESHKRAGFVTEFGLAVPPRSRFFGELIGQYRYVGRVTAGPFATRVSTLSGAASTLPATSVNLSHWFFGLGAGMRF